MDDTQVYACISAYAIAGMGFERFFLLEGDPLQDEIRKEVDFMSGGTKQDAGARPAVGQNKPPLFFQGRPVVDGKPILVVEQDEVRVAPGIFLQKAGDGVIVGLNTMTSFSKEIEVGGFQVRGAAIIGVLPLQVELPEIIVVKRLPGENPPQAFLDKAQGSTFIFIAKKLLLTAGNANQTHSQVAVNHPFDEAVENALFQLVIKYSLAFQVFRFEQGTYLFKEALRP